MIKDKAVTGKVDKPAKSPDDSPVPPKKVKESVKESYKSRMKRLSKKYKKSPEEIKKILNSKEYKQGRKSM